MTGETEPLSELGDHRRTLADRYELAERIGLGGMAEVWRARDLRLDRDVAVKLLPTAATRDPSSRRRIEREARALAAANHPNIVSVYDYGEEAASEDADVVPYLVMELVDGPDLDRYLTERGPLPVEEARDLIAGVLAAVAHAHAAGVVHGDLKPANVFIGPHGPKVGDFGVARILHEESGTTTAAATPSFAAPEVLRGERPGPPADVYSAGCLAFQLLTGHPPFEGSNAWEVATKHAEAPIPKVRRARPDVDPGMDAAIHRAMDKTPRRRFQDASGFAAAVGGIGGASVRPSAGPSETVPIAASPAAAADQTQALTRPRPDPARVAVFGPFAGWWDRATRSSPNGRVLLLLLLPLLLLLAFLTLRSPGPALRTVPDLAGDPYREAVAELREQGLKPDVSFRPIVEGEPGRVIETIPAADAQLAEGAEVHVIAGALAQTPAPTVAPAAERSDDDGGDGGREGRGERNGKGKGKRGDD